MKEPRIFPQMERVALDARVSRRRVRSAAFTLVEVLIGATLSAAVMAAVLSSYIYMGRNLARLANLQTLESEGRRTLALFSRDVRMASGLVTISTSPTSPASNRVDLTIPTASGTNIVTYYYNPKSSPDTVSISGTSIAMPANTLTRCVYTGSGTPSALTLLRLRNVNDTTVATRSDLTIRYYDASGNEYTAYTDYLPGIKEVSLEFTSANGNNTDDSASAQSANYQTRSGRMVLRNRALLQ